MIVSLNKFSCIKTDDERIKQWFLPRKTGWTARSWTQQIFVVIFTIYTDWVDIDRTKYHKHVKLFPLIRKLEFTYHLLICLKFFQFLFHFLNKLKLNCADCTSNDIFLVKSQLFIIERIALRTNNWYEKNTWKNR